MTILTSDLMPDSLLGKLKSLFGGGSSPPEEETQTGSLENTPPRETDSVPSSSPSSSSESESASSSSSQSSSSAAPQPTKDKKDVSKENTIILTVNNHFTSIAPMTVEEKRKARTRYVPNKVSIFVFGPGL